MTHDRQTARLHRDDSATARWDPATARAFHLAAAQAERCGLLEDWRQVEPALADVASVAALPLTIARCANAQRDLLLAALIRLTQTGDDTAAVTLLWTMAPWLRQAAMRTYRRWAGDHGLSFTYIRDNLQSRLYEVVLGFPTTRIRSGVLPRLQLDTLRDDSHLEFDAHREPAVPLEHFFDALAAGPGPKSVVSDLDGSSVEMRPTSERPLAVGEVPDRSTEVRVLLAWAVRESVIAARDARLLFEVYLADPSRQGVPNAAARSNMSENCVRQRCSRATRALARAVAEGRNVSSAA